MQIFCLRKKKILKYIIDDIEIPSCSNREKSAEENSDQKFLKKKIQTKDFKNKIPIK